MVCKIGYYLNEYFSTNYNATGALSVVIAGAFTSAEKADHMEKSLVRIPTLQTLLQFFKMHNWHFNDIEIVTESDIGLGK
jgi:hypothetical protein